MKYFGALASALRRPVVLRGASALVVLIVAVGVYHYWSRPLASARQAKRIPEVVAWQESSTPFWERLPYLPLSDKTVVRAHIWAAMQECELLAPVKPEDQKGLAPNEVPHVQRTKLLEELPQHEAEDLADVLTAVLFAMGQETVDGYLEAVKALRRIPEKPTENPFVPSAYKGATGHLMPPDLTCREAFETLWKSRSDTYGRPVEASIAKSEGMLFSFLTWDGVSRPVSREEPKAYSDPTWGNPISASLVQVSCPLATSKDLAKTYGKVNGMYFHVLIRDRQGRVVPLQIHLVWNAGSSSWAWEGAGVETDLGVFWPM
jgi:hypothetical protein